MVERSSLVAAYTQSHSTPFLFLTLRHPCSLSLRCQRIQAFVILFSVAIALMALAIVVFLPMILFAPSKFALCFTTGSLCFMAAFASFSGPTTFAKGLFAKDRVWFAVGYVGSLCTCWCLQNCSSFGVGGAVGYRLTLRPCLLPLRRL